MTFINMRNYSIYLIVVIAAGILMLFLPVSTVRITASGFDASPMRTIEITAFSNTEVLSQSNPHTGKNIVLPVCIILCILNSFAVIFFVKNDSVRAKLCGLNYVFICATIVLVFYYCDFQTSLKNILVVSDYHAGAMPDVMKYQAAIQADNNMFPFGKHMFKESATDNVSPLVWWECIAKSINPKTLNLVEQLHTAIASSAGLERLFSTFGLVHSKIRNRLGVEKSAKLVAVFKTLNGEEKYNDE